MTFFKPVFLFPPSHICNGPTFGRIALKGRAKIGAFCFSPCLRKTAVLKILCANQPNQEDKTSTSAAIRHSVTVHSPLITSYSRIGGSGSEDRCVGQRCGFSLHIVRADSLVPVPSLRLFAVAPYSTPHVYIDIFMV
ncbi:hypothetical protein BM221_001015 [Beauveria bassiana]|uniref:Uncharacterized protein n=1 Tax=Beauveria bassiana TaxID=176275 RepID=A0A2N6P231_BEABA|nr:hypothetical protein BM221_001015 [Beauveria bassiana]